jgi:hypothetical protein
VSQAHDDAAIVDFAAGALVQNQRLLLHSSLSVLGGGPGFAES